MKVSRVKVSSAPTAEVVAEADTTGALVATAATEVVKPLVVGAALETAVEVVGVATELATAEEAGVSSAEPDS